MAKKKARPRRPQPTPMPQAAPLTESERGVQAFTRNDYDTAITAWTGVLRAQASLSGASALAQAHYCLGTSACLRRQTIEALGHWLSALNAGFDSPTVRHNLVTAYSTRCFEQIKSPALLNLVRSALKISPESPILLRLRHYAEYMD